MGTSDPLLGGGHLTSSLKRERESIKKEEERHGLKRRHGKRSHPSGHRGRRRSSRPEDANRRIVQTKVRGVFESVRGVCGTHRRRRDWGETLHRAVFRLLVMCGPLRGWTDDETHELK